MLGTNTLGNLTYAYDLAGRRMGLGGSFARTNAPLAATAATYNVNNQLTQWKGATLTYDPNGNLTTDGTNIYTWNARNQLVSISGGVSASFQYDPFGRRVSKTIGGTTQYLYDGANPVQEIAGTSASANLLAGGVDEFFQRTDAAGARSFLTDALGSTLALADSSGTPQTQYTFEPFGSTSVTGTATTNGFAYTGRELDMTGLYFLRGRYYNPQFGRFISEDPIGLLGGTNQYLYVGNSPTNGRDPFGLFWPDHHEGIAKAAALAAGYRYPEALRIALEDWMTDFAPNSQDTDAFDANTHAMAGRKPNRKYQTCEQALQGTIDRLKDSIRAGTLRPALHTIADAQAEGHRFKPWEGEIPGPAHEFHDEFPSTRAYLDALGNSVRFLRDAKNNQINADVSVYLRSSDGHPCQSR